MRYQCLVNTQSREISSTLSWIQACISSRRGDKRGPDYDGNRAEAHHDHGGWQTCVADYGLSTDLRASGLLPLRGEAKAAGIADVQKNPALASAGDIAAACWASRINHFRWPPTCTIQARKRENTQMWVVWSLSTLVGFCFVLSFFETAPAEARSRSTKMF